MSRKLTLMFAAALTVGTASLAAASAASVQLIQSHVDRINSCQDSSGGLRTIIVNHLTATGATVDPVAPCSFRGCMMKANSETPLADSSSSLRFSNRCTP